MAREFVLLALRLDRLVPGAVGFHLGDPELRRRVADAPAPTPSELVHGAAALAGEVRAAGVDRHRAEVLLAQLAAVGTIARRLDGAAVGFRREVELCLGLPARLGSEDDYRATHRELDGLLPGRGPLADRMAAHRHRDELPPDRLLPAVRAVAAALRERARGPYRLPADEEVTVAVVPDAPWSALHQHAGAYRSLVRLNRGARLRAGQLAQLVAHETYPGHHTETCRLRGGPLARGQHEHQVGLVLSPVSAVSEGLADSGLAALVGPGWGRWAADVLAGVGVRTDGELVEAVEQAMVGLLRVRQDAALLLHDRRAGEDAARRHLRRWLLVDERRAGQMLAFLTHPMWRAYVTAYVEGYLLVREHLGSDRTAMLARHVARTGHPTIPALLAPGQDEPAGAPAVSRPGERAAL